MRRAWRGSVALAAAVLLGACGDDGSVSEAEWSLEGMSPDGRHLLVAVPFGGVASDCARWEGADVVVTDDAVTVNAQLWRRNGGDCTDDGAVEFVQLALEEPLGERALLGCGRTECVTTFAPFGRGLLDPGRVVAAGDTIAVQGPRSVDLYRLDGTPIASIDGWASGEVLGLADGTVVRTPGDAWQTAIGTDASTGEDRWVSTGWTAGVGADTVYLCRGDDEVGLAAVDPATGEDRWTSGLPCDFVVLGDRLVSVTYDPMVDGGNRVVVGDVATGEVVVDESIFDGVNDQVAAFDGLVTWENRLVTGGSQSDLVAIDSDGREVERWGSQVGSPVGVVDDVLLSVDNGRGVLAHHLGTGADLWRIDTLEPWRTFVFDSGGAWLLSDDRRAVSRIDPETGQVMWETAIGSSSSIGAALIDDLAVVVTTQALLGVDAWTGELLWSVVRPYDG